MEPPERWEKQAVNWTRLVELVVFLALMSGWHRIAVWLVTGH